MLVPLGSEFRRARAEQLALCFQLYVDLKSDYRFVIHTSRYSNEKTFYGRINYFATFFCHLENRVFPKTAYPRDGKPKIKNAFTAFGIDIGDFMPSGYSVFV